MWERRLFSKRGRMLWVVRRIAFVPPPLLSQFLHMAASPTRGVALVLRSNPGLHRVAAGLALAGLLRGVLEGLGYYLRAGLVAQLGALLLTPSWLGRYAGPVLLLQELHTAFLWLSVAGLLYGAGRLLGGKGSFRPLLQLSGVALFSAPTAALINCLNLPWPAALGVLHRSPLGVGHLVAGVWLTVVCYQALRRVHRLDGFAAAMAAPLPVVAALVLSLAAGGLAFGLVPTLPVGDMPAVWLAMAWRP